MHDEAGVVIIKHEGLVLLKAWHTLSEMNSQTAVHVAYLFVMKEMSWSSSPMARS